MSTLQSVPIHHRETERNREQPTAMSHNHSVTSSRAGRHAHSIERRAGRATRRGLRALAAVLMGVGALFLLLTVGASAATLNGVATVETPQDGTLTGSQASNTEFTVVLPASAACSGDTASGGYHVYTFLDPATTSVTSISFVGHPATGEGLYNNTGAYQGPFNTAPVTGQITTLPIDFEFGPAIASDKLLSTVLAGGGVFDAGVVCANSSGTVTDFWSTQITFTASSTDPDGFVWAAAAATTTTTTTTTAASTTASTTGSTTGSTTSSGGTTGTTATGGTGTTAGANGTSGSSSSGSTGTSGTTAGASGSTTGSLPFTGMPAPVTKIVGAGFLGIGLGLMLLSSAGRRRLGVLREAGSALR